MSTIVNDVKIFTLEDLIVTDKSLREKYRKRENYEKTSIHWGQRKLILSEIEFFTFYWDPLKIPAPLCVYAGAADGAHISLLSNLFPAFSFHLYDPREFKISESRNIKIFQEYFTDEIAQKYTGRNDVFFISDIRTTDYKKINRDTFIKELKIPDLNENFDSDGIPVKNIQDNLNNKVFKSIEAKAKTIIEEKVWEDMEMQQQWVIIIDPLHAFLKFRLPYPNKEDYNNLLKIKRNYLMGTIFFQPWAPMSSTESRLVPVRNINGKYEKKEWDIVEYEEWFFYNNNVNREKSFYANIFNLSNDPIDAPELLNDYDSISESMILKSYFEKFNSKDVYKDVQKLSKLITIFLNSYIKKNKYLDSLRNPFKEKYDINKDAFRNKEKFFPVIRSPPMQTKLLELPTIIPRKIEISSRNKSSDIMPKSTVVNVSPKINITTKIPFPTKINVPTKSGIL